MLNTDEPIAYKDITVKYREHGEYQYFASFAVSFGYRGLKTTTLDDTGITLARLWADGELIYDIATGKVASGVKWYIRKGTEDQDPIPGWDLAYRGHLLICFVDYPLGDNASIPTISAEFIDTVTYSVAGIMETFATLAGYSDEDVTTTGLDSLPVLGYLLDGQATLEGVATELGFLYDFTMSETAGVVAFSRKYEDGELVVDQTVQDGYLAQLNEGSSDGRISVMERSADQSLPSKISAQYFDVDANYDTGNQSVQRNGGPIKTHSSTADISITVPIVAEGAEIRSLLYDALTRAWQERNGHSLRLPPMFLALNPGDTLGWSNWGAEYVGLLVKTTINADNSISASLIEKDADYAPNEIATQAPATPIAHVGHDLFNAVLFDAPDTDEDQTVADYVNVRVAIGGIVPGTFYGARLELARLEPLPTWNTALNLIASEEVMVAVLTTIGSSTIQIAPNNMTGARLTAGIGEPLVIGAGSTSEIVTYTGWSDLGGGIYELTGVDRGLFGSELFITKHVPGEFAAFMDDMPIIQIAALDYTSGQQFLWRVIPDGMPVWEAETQVFVPSGNSRKPYSPDNVVVTRSAGDWTITWDTDDRFTGEPDSIFSIDIYNSDWTAIVRRINGLNTSVSGNTYTYFIEEQMIDGVNELDFLNALVYQVNASHVGRGFPGGGNLIPADTTVYLEGTIDVDPELTGSIQQGMDLAGTIDVDPAIEGDLSVVPPVTVTVKGIGPEVFSASSANIILTAPTTVDANDLMLAFIQRRQGLSSSPAGWVRVAHSRGGSTVAAQDFDVWAKHADGSEDSVSYTWSQPGAADRSGFIITVGASDGQPVDFLDINIKQEDLANGTSLPIITATAEDNGQLAIAGVLTLTTTSGQTPTAPAGMTLIHSGAQTNRRLYLAYQELDDTETASGSFSLSASQNRNTMQITLLLCPQRSVNTEAVSYTGAGTWVNSTGATSQNLDTPADVNDDDLLLALIQATSTVTPPAGWTSVDTVAFTGGGITNTIHLFKKDAVTTADEAISTTWGQSASGRFSGQIVGYRTASGTTPDIRRIAKNFGNHGTNWVDFVGVPMPVESDGQAVLKVSSWLAQTGTTSVSSTPPSGVDYVTSTASMTDRRFFAIQADGLFHNDVFEHEPFQSGGGGTNQFWCYMTLLISGPNV
jgi:hypothetical protein